MKTLEILHELTESNIRVEEYQEFGDNLIIRTEETSIHNKYLKNFNCVISVEEGKISLFINKKNIENIKLKIVS